MIWAKILNGREERYKLELKLLEQFKKPIMVVTVNYPGEMKLDVISEIIFQQAVKSVQDFGFILTVSGKNFAGQYFIGVFSNDPIEAKKMAVKIEENHPLGRFFDIDIIDYPFKKIGREDLGLNERECILCNGNARECILERRHSASEVLAKIRNMVEEYLKYGL